tara:strand:- start:1176 stop:1361 length:186 start_codon:yes stop_codon:yes gene_type:complete
MIHYVIRSLLGRTKLLFKFEFKNKNINNTNDLLEGKQNFKENFSKSRLPLPKESTIIVSFD